MSRRLETDTPLAILREAKGLSREAVAAMAQEAGYSLSYDGLTKYEREEREPRVRLGLWLARLYEAEPGELWEIR